jgi:hypothetical protein
MKTIEILDGEESYDPTDVKPEYDLPALREQARREGREYRGILSGCVGRNDCGQDESVAKAIETTNGEACGSVFRTGIKP